MHRLKSSNTPERKGESRRGPEISRLVCVLAHFAMVIQEDEADGGGTNAQWHDDEENDELIGFVDRLVERTTH